MDQFVGRSHEKVSLGLIACSKSKGPKRSLAFLLYQGALFRKSLSLASRRCDHVCILSAKHGLVNLNDPLEPYEQTLSGMALSERKAWARKVCAQIADQYPGADLIYFAGDLYLQGLPKGQEPMKGMTIGRRLQWLDQQLKGKSLI